MCIMQYVMNVKMKAQNAKYAELTINNVNVLTFVKNKSYFLL